MGDNDFSVEHTGVRVRQMAGTLERVVKYDAVAFQKAWDFLASSDDEDKYFLFIYFSVELFSPEREQNMAFFWGATVFFAADGPSRVMCVCVFSSHSFWTSMDVPAGVTQEEGNTDFSIHLLSAVLALIFLARRIQPFLSLVDREVEFVY